MSRTATALAKLQSRWNGLLEKRSTERFSQFPELSLAQIGEVFGHWNDIVETLEDKKLFQSSAELATADIEIASAVSSISALVANAQTEGLEYLIQNGFFKALTGAQTVLAALTTKRIAVTREIAKDLKKRGYQEIELILRAAKDAEEVLAARDKVDETLKSLDSTAAVANGSVEKVQQLVSAALQLEIELKRLESDAKASAQAASDASAKIEGTSRAIAKLKEDAEAREANLEARVSEANKEIAALKSEASEARESLRLALRMARDQGLAKSFQSRSDKLRAERRLWTITFVGAAAVLATLAVVFVTDLYDLRYETLVVAILRKLALAAPAVWLGWYAARQVGRVARVQEDYEYKAASALAFQSYKEEAALGADPELIKQLLKHAIDTFGENPVRLYNDVTVDPVTPLESGLKSLPPDKLIALLTAALDAAARKKG